MDARAIAQLLGKLPFSAPLPQAVVDRLAASATIRSYPADTVLFREGMHNDQLMIIAAGHVALDMRVAARHEVRILSLGPGDMLAWSALLGGGWMTTSATAVQDTQVVAVSADAALALCEANPDFGYHLMRQVALALANRLVATRLQLLDSFADAQPAVARGPD
ncbi:MAG: Crp/Fnr family transcriptional regulator [Pirellulales bacterium]